MASGLGAVRTAHTSSRHLHPTRLLAIVFIVIRHFSGKLSMRFSHFPSKRALDAGSALWGIIIFTGQKGSERLRTESSLLLPLDRKMFDPNAIAIKAIAGLT